MGRGGGALDRGLVDREVGEWQVLDVVLEGELDAEVLAGLDRVRRAEGQRSLQRGVQRGSAVTAAGAVAAGAWEARCGADCFGAARTRRDASISAASMSAPEVSWSGPKPSSPMLSR